MWEDGKKHGLETWRWEDGEKWELIWHRGKRMGMERQWHQRGQKMKKSMWRNGNQHGASIGWYEDGQKSWEAHLIHEKEYARIEWDEKGNVTKIKLPSIATIAIAKLKTYYRDVIKNQPS